jgi:hypothetical protein
MDSRFLQATKGLPFTFGNGENITERSLQTLSQSLVHLPDAVEMVFYNFGSITYCGELPTLTNYTQSVIGVQVPIQQGGLNLTGATIVNLATP